MKTAFFFAAELEERYNSSVFIVVFTEE